MMNVWEISFSEVKIIQMNGKTIMKAPMARMICRLIVCAVLAPGFLPASLRVETGTAVLAMWLLLVLVMHPAPLGIQLEDRDHQDDRKQNHRGGGALTEGEVDKGQLEDME